MQHFYLRLKPSETVRFIISISKKVSKSAVARNTLRRRIRPIVREFIPSLKPATYLIVANPSALHLKGQELERELKLLVVGRQL